MAATGQDGDRAALLAHADRRRAQAYAEFFAPVTARFLPFLRDAVPPDAETVVDLGAGGSALLGQLAGRVRRRIALDSAAAMLADCRAEPGVWAVVGDAMALPLADASCDAASAAFLLPHLPDAGRALAECRRVLRPGAPLLQLSWAGPAESPFTGLASTLLRDHGSAEVRDRLVAAEERTSARWVSEQLTAAGFAVESVETLRTSVPVPSPGAWWRGMIGASTGLSQLLHITDTDVRAAVEEQFLERAEAFRQGSELRVPVAAQLLRGVHTGRRIEQAHRAIQ